jgi:hypothetical protein
MMMNDTNNNSARSKTVMLITCGCPKCNPQAMDKKDKEKLLNSLQIREQDTLFYTVEDINTIAKDGVATVTAKVLKAQPSIRAICVYASTSCERVRQKLEPLIQDEQRLNIAIRHQQMSDMLVGSTILRDALNNLHRQAPISITVFHHDKSWAPIPKRVQI